MKTLCLNNNLVLELSQPYVWDKFVALEIYDTTEEPQCESWGFIGVRQ